MKTAASSSSGKLLPTLCLVYLLLPFCVFVCGFLRPLWAVLFLLCAVVSFVLAVRLMPAMWQPAFCRANAPKLALMGFLILLTALLSGVGGYVFQTYDHMARNQIFRLLVLRDWPVTVASVSELAPDTTLVYYIGFWLPAAAVGKLFGSVEAGFFAQYLWAALGIAMLCYLLCAWRKKLAIWPCVVFFAFSGLDMVGALLTHCLPFFQREQELARTVQIEWWAASCLQYSSNLTQLFWVFNQSIPAWCAMLFLLLQPNGKISVLILSTMVLTSCLPFLGLLPLFLAFLFSAPVKGDPLQRGMLPPKKAFAAVRELFTVPNVLGGGVVGIVSYLYLQAKQSDLAFGLNYFGGNQISWCVLIAFWLLEVGVYAVLTLRYQRRNPLFWAAMGMLALCPFIRFGYYHDFVMRVSIPSLVLLTLFVIDALAKSQEQGRKPLFAALVVALCLGALNPGLELDRTLYQTYATLAAGKPVTRDMWDEDAVLVNPVYTGRLEGNFFFDVLGKRAK